jgi:hypothetical protein
VIAGKLIIHAPIRQKSRLDGIPSWRDKVAKIYRTHERSGVQKRQKRWQRGKREDMRR